MTDTPQTASAPGMTALNAALCARILAVASQCGWIRNSDLLDIIQAAVPEVTRYVVSARIATLRAQGYFERRYFSTAQEIRLLHPRLAVRNACLIMIRNSSGPVSIATLADEIGVDPARLSSPLLTLCRSGLIVKASGAHGPVYSLTPALATYSTAKIPVPARPKGLPPAGHTRAGADPMVRVMAARRGCAPDALAADLRTMLHRGEQSA